jgi:putative PIN family toxin of toxin-antitoxin system
MRVVVDTNILVSFAIRPNPDFEKIFDHIAAHGVSLVSDDTLAELFDVLSRDRFRKYIPCRVGAVEDSNMLSGLFRTRFARPA